MPSKVSADFFSKKILKLYSINKKQYTIYSDMAVQYQPTLHMHLHMLQQHPHITYIQPHTYTRIPAHIVPTSRCDASIPHQL